MWFVDSSGAFLRKFKFLFHLWCACESPTGICSLTRVSVLKGILKCSFQLQLCHVSCGIADSRLPLVTFPREVDDTMPWHVLQRAHGAGD